jgi:hypothetical protein
VFLVNSRLGLVTATPSSSSRMGLHPTGAYLLPKLRYEFAEFLDKGSLVHLGMLYQPTCVGLRYGRPNPSLDAFLGSSASIRPVQAWRLPLPLGSRSSSQRICLSGLPTTLEGLATPGPSSLRHALTQTVSGRDGNLHPLSIAYVFRPRLRPASPAVDQHRCGTLGHSVGRILTPLALLMPTFALVAAPGLLTRPLLG